MSEKSLSIEEQSLKIIDSEIGNHDYNRDEWFIVRRVIHSTADFDFAKSGKIIFSKDAIKSAFQALSGNKTIVTDVEMVRSGINKNSMQKIKINAICNISDKLVIQESRISNKTRSAVAMRHAIPIIEGGILVVGNAPTALFEIINIIHEKSANPALVIGLPVGFVSAVESKNKIRDIECEYITNLGRKGGSSAASSIINALMLLYIEKYLS